MVRLNPPKAEDVAVVIPCYRQKRFLASALESVSGQTFPAAEIIVVDDGSGEDLGDVVAAFENARLISQANRGLAGARNTGLRAASSKRIIFLDADDRLLPTAIESGLECFSQNPSAAFVYGGYRVIVRGEVSTTFNPVSTHRELLACNWIGMIATVMFDRRILVRHGGFDESLAMCEDWDAYLRISRTEALASHPDIVADYVMHGKNASLDLDKLWSWVKVVRQKEWERGLDAEGQAAWRDGEETSRAVLFPPPVTGANLFLRASRKILRLFRSVQSV